MHTTKMMRHIIVGALISGAIVYSGDNGGQPVSRAVISNTVDRQGLTTTTLTTIDLAAGTTKT